MTTNPFEKFDQPENPFEKFDQPAATENPFSKLGQPSQSPTNQNTGLLGDVGTSLKRGVEELPGAVTGFLDIAPALTLGMRPFTKAAEAAGEFTGFQPGKWAEQARQEYSPGYQAAQQEIGQAWETGTPLDIAKAYATNPSAIANIVAESAPSMLVGGAIGRGLMLAGGAAEAVPVIEGVASRVTPRVVGALERRFGEQTASAIAGGAGEGIVQAGQALSQAEGGDQRKAAIAALGSGLVDAVIGAGAGRIAQRLGFETVETLAAKGFNRAVTNEIETLATRGRRIAGGAVSEGLLQELPQSAQEQVAQNYAEGKPLWEGVARSAVEGALAGFVMGAGANAAGAPKAQDPVVDQGQAQLLAGLIGQEVNVTNGQATVDGITVPVDTLAKHLAAGGTLETLPDSVLFPGATPEEAQVLRFEREARSYVQGRNVPGATPAVAPTPTPAQAPLQPPPREAELAAAEAAYQQYRPLLPEEVEEQRAAEQALAYNRARNVPAPPASIPEAAQAPSQPSPREAELAAAEAAYQQYSPLTPEEEEVRRFEQEARAYTQARNAPAPAPTEEQLAARVTEARNASERAIAEEEYRRYVAGEPPLRDLVNAKGRPFSSLAATKAAAREVDPEAFYIIIESTSESGTKGYMAQRITAEPASLFTKKDGGGFASEAALTRMATKENVNLAQFDVVETTKGFVAVPRGVGQAGQAGQAPTTEVPPAAQTSQELQAGPGQRQAAFRDDFAKAFQEANAEGDNYVSLVELRKKLGSYTKEEFDEFSKELRTSREYTFASASGRQGGYTEDELAAGIPSGGRMLLNVSYTPERATPGVQAASTEAATLAQTSPIQEVTLSSRSAANGAIRRQGLTETHTVEERSDGTFAVVPKAAGVTYEAPEELEAPQDKYVPLATGQTNLGDVLAEVMMSTNPTTRVLGRTLNHLIPKEKRDIKVLITPKARSAAYSPYFNRIAIKDRGRLDVSLHEIVHAVTVRELKNDKATQRRINALMGQVRAAVIERGIFTKEQLDAFDRASTSQAFKKQFADLRSGSRGIAYAFLNQEEFLAQAFSSPEFQTLLKSVYVQERGKVMSVWDSLIEKIMRVLGVAASQKTAFEEAISIAAQLAKANPEVVPVSQGASMAFESVDESLRFGKEKVTAAIKSLADPKSRSRELYLQYAPQWLSVTPLNTLTKTFGKKIPQIAKFSDYLDRVVSTKTKLIDNSKDLYDEVVAAASAEELQAFNYAAAIATFNRMLPAKSIMEQDWVPANGTRQERLDAAQKRWAAAGMQRDTGKTFVAAHEEAVAAYRKLSPQLKSSYGKIVDDVRRIRDREKNNLLTYIEQTSPPDSTLRDNLMARFNATFNNLQGAYLPLSRVGDFRMEYIDQDGFPVVKYYSTIAERRADRENLVAAGVDASTIKEDVKDKRPRGEVAIPIELMAQLSAVVTNQHLEGVDPNDAEAVSDARAAAQETIDDMNQIWLRWQPETSALKNSIQRKNVRGFDTDMLRSYLEYVQRHASSIAWTEQGRRIEQTLLSLSNDIAEKRAADQAVDVTMDRHILNDLRARVQALRSASIGAVASTLGKLGTAYYMTSPSTALVQMSQLAVLTLPRLAATYGPTRASKALAGGVKEAFSKRFSKSAMMSDPAVETVHQNIGARVTTDNRDQPQAQGKNLGDRLFSREEIEKQVARLSKYQRQLLVLRESLDRNLLDISSAHEAYALSRGGAPNSVWNKAIHLALLPMRESELASRKATILATYDLASEKGENFANAMNDISGVVNDTLFSFAKEQRGAALQGGLARVLLQFQHYRIMTGIRLALMFNDAVRGESPETKRQARKELIGIMGMTGALSGAVGLPMASTMMAIASALLGDDDEPFDAELEFNNWLQDTFGETGGTLLAGGLPAVAGVDLSRRIGLGDIYGSQNDPPSRLHGRDLAAWWAASQLGPAFSVGASWAQGYDEIVNKGNYLRGLEAATPKPIKDVLKAYRVASEGLKTGAGKKILSDEEIGADEIMLIALGFNPEEVAKAQKAQRSLGKISAQISDRRGRLINEAAQAIIDGDMSGDARQSITEFNSKMPRFAIRGGDIRSAVRRISLGEQGAAGQRERALAQQFNVPVYQGE